MEKSLGEKLRELREKRGWTQIYAAKIFDITNGALSNYERDERMPDAKMLKKFAEVYEVSIDYLMGTNTPADNTLEPHIPEDYAKKYKVTKKDLIQYEDFIQHAGAFFMNDEVAEEDKEKLFRDISELFWKSKEINKEKYGKKKKQSTK